MSDVASDDEDDDLYPACTVTRAIAKKKQAENTPALNKDYPSKDIDLYETFMSTIDDSVPRNIGETKVPFHVDQYPS